MRAAPRNARRSTSGVLMRVLGSIALSGTFLWGLLSVRSMLRASRPEESRPDLSSLVAEINDNNNDYGKQQAEHPVAERGQPMLHAWEPESCQSIVFFHIPKTGGESLNALWMTADPSPKKRDLLPYGWSTYRYFGMRKTNMPKARQKGFLIGLKPWTRSTKQRRMRHNVIELHCGDSLSFMEAKDVVAEMRAEHNKHGCGFFAFTVLRSPLDWVVSLYDDICHRRLRGHKDTCPQKAGMSSREEMLRYPHRNGLVSYLRHGWAGWDSPGPVGESDVQEVAQAMHDVLDTVVLTEDMLRLRYHLTKRFAAPNGRLNAPQESRLVEKSVHNANLEKTVRVSDFNAEEIKRLNSTVQLDWKLFDKLQGSRRPWA